MVRGFRILIAATAVVALAAFAAACGGGASNDDQGEALSAPRSQAGAPLADSLAPSSEKGAAATASGNGGTALPSAASSERKVIFTATLVLQSQDVQATFAAVEQAARAATGYVQKSSVGTRRGTDGVERATATITIRVPADRYETTITGLRALAGVKVEREDSTSTEVTEEYTDLESRLRNLERSEAQYLVLLQQAKTIQEILTVNERIDSVRNQIEQIKGRLRLLDDLTDLATITVTIYTPEPGAKPAEDNGPKSFTDAFGDAWDSALEAGRYLLAASAVALVVAIWLAIPIAALAGLAIWMNRRGRKASTPNAAPQEPGEA